jgi:hypothetical protein
LRNGRLQRIPVEIAAQQGANPVQAVIEPRRAAIEHKGAFAPRRHQPGAHQQLEVVAERGLTNAEHMAQLRHAVGIARQHAQDLRAQRIAQRLAQRGQIGQLGAARGGRPVVGHGGHGDDSTPARPLHQNISMQSGCLSGLRR